MNIPILYEDQWFILVDKPPGLLTVPTPRHERRTLTSVLNEDAAQRGHAGTLYPCHRLDRETSGVIIYAKGPAALERMQDLFRRRSVAKQYIAFAHGRVRPAQGIVRTPIAGAQASTRYRVIGSCPAFSVVEVRPQTGRTNQIRIHFKHLGHPLVGESIFAFRKDFALKAKRVFLHAQSVSFRHPFTAADSAVSAPLAEDMRRFLEKHGCRV